MDAFSEILGGLALKGAMFFSAEFSAPWGFSTPPSRYLAPVVAPGSPHLVVYHFLIEGSGFVLLEDGSKLRLEAGDVIVLPHGEAHEMCSAEGVQEKETPVIIAKIQARDLGRFTREAAARSRGSCAATWRAILCCAGRFSRVCLQHSK